MATLFKAAILVSGVACVLLMGAAGFAFHALRHAGRRAGLIADS